jgi:hypothetical protein
MGLRLSDRFPIFSEWTFGDLFRLDFTVVKFIVKQGTFILICKEPLTF